MDQGFANPCRLGRHDPADDNEMITAVVSRVRAAR
jgi:hypothetical protein